MYDRTFVIHHINLVTEENSSVLNFFHKTLVSELIFNMTKVAFQMLALALVRKQKEYLEANGVIIERLVSFLKIR